MYYIIHNKNALYVKTSFGHKPSSGDTYEFYNDILLTLIRTNCFNGTLSNRELLDNTVKSNQIKSHKCVK